MIHLRFLFLPLFILLFTRQGFTKCGDNRENTIQIRATGLPEGYRVFEWDGAPFEKGAEPKPTGYTAKYIQEFTFNIPVDCIEYDGDHSIALYLSLENWRNGTNKSAFEPRTDPSTGVRRFPFYSKDDPTNATDGSDIVPKRFFGLIAALENKKNFPNMRFKASNGRHVSLKIPGVIDRLQSLKDVKSISCTSNSRKPAECLACNCANESGVEEHGGRVAINRTVLRRIQGNVNTYYNPDDTICGAIWADGQFSWTFAGMSHKQLGGSLLKECIQASIDAVKAGPWQYDSFHNPKIASPKRNIVGKPYLPPYKKQQHIFYAVKSFVLKPKKQREESLRKALYSEEEIESGAE